MEGFHLISIMTVIIAAIAHVLILTILGPPGIVAAVIIGAFSFLVSMLRRDEFPYLYSSKMSTEE